MSGPYGTRAYRNLARPDSGRARDSGAGRPAPGGTPRWWGSRPGRLGVLFVVAGTTAGLIGTVLAGSEPGFVLAMGLLLGTVCGAAVVRPGSAYLIIPVPALAYTAAAVVAGFVHDHALDTSRTALAVGLAQWIASGFLAMITATLLAIAMVAVRWLGSRHTML
ncbi:MAG: DUF6542 domain-containing protein [Streptosporangiaceae bacterium]